MIMIDKRIEHYEKENARLFGLINESFGKENRNLIIKTINEHQAVIKELKYIKNLNIPNVSKAEGVQLPEAKENILIDNIKLVNSLIDQIGRDNEPATRGAAKIRIGAIIKRLL